MKLFILVGFILMFAVFLPLFGINHGTVRTVFKGLCTATALALCILGAAQLQSAFGWLMVTGMFFGLLGDLVIQYKLLGGMLFFFAGHVFYCAAFWLQKTPGLLSLAIFALLFAAVFVIGMKYFKKMEFGIWPCIAYAALLSAMTALALPLFGVWANGRFAAIGAALFFVSDATLAALTCAPPKKPALLGGFSITCYFLGQFLLALSVCCPAL